MIWPAKVNKSYTEFTMSPTDEARERNLDEGLEDMTKRARDKMKGKTLGSSEEREEERVPGERSGDKKQVWGFKSARTTASATGSQPNWKWRSRPTPRLMC